MEFLGQKRIGDFEKRKENFLDLRVKSKNMVKLCDNEIYNNCPNFLSVGVVAGPEFYQNIKILMRLTRSVPLKGIN